MAYTYTTLEFDKIKELYANGQTLEDILSLFPDKSVASIRMKLVKAGVYTKPTKATAKATATAKPASEPKPTTKTAIKAAYKAASDAVGPAPW